MRGIHSVVDDIRRDVFTEVARLAYEGGDYKQIDALPYKIIPGEVAQYRHDVFLERAIVTERLRLACGGDAFCNLALQCGILFCLLLACLRQYINLAHKLR